MKIEQLRQLFNCNHTYEYDKIESPIEEIFLNHIIKFLDQNTELSIQYPISTISGNFRADIALIKEGKIVVIECDGEEHHTQEKDIWYDEWRDTLILAQERANVIYRVRGIDIYSNLYKVFAIIYYYEKELFDDKFAKRLEVFEIHGNCYKKRVFFEHINDEGKIIPAMVEVKRKQLYKDFDRFWFRYILYSLLYNDKNIYDLIDIMLTERLEMKDLKKMLKEKHPDLELEDENIC